MAPRVAALLLALAVAPSGCAFFWAGSQQDVTLTASQPGVAVRLDGADVGALPSRVHLSRTKPHRLEFQCEGYVPYIVKLEPEVDDSWVMADILCGLLPAMVDAATGSWNTFGGDRIHMVLAAPADTAGIHAHRQGASGRYYMRPLPQAPGAGPAAELVPVGR